MENRLKKLRLKNNLSILDICKYLRISEKKYLNYENNNILPPVNLLSSLAKLYSTSIDYLVGDTDSPIPHKKI